MTGGRLRSLCKARAQTPDETVSNLGAEVRHESSEAASQFTSAGGAII